MRIYEFKNGKVNLIWDFEFILANITTSKRTDLVLEEKTEKTNLWAFDMTYLQQINIKAKSQ